MVGVSWVKLDDRFPTNPKVFGLTDAAFRAYISGLCYAGQHLTDGFVPAGYVKPRLARELVSSGLWLQSGAGFTIHDYLTYNLSREESENRSSAASTAARMRHAYDSQSEEQSNGLGGKEGGRGRDLDGRKKQGTPDGFDAFWAVYPRKVGKPKAQTAYASALRRDFKPSEIFAGAERYRDDPNRLDEFTAHPSTWLARDGWNDPELPARGTGGSQPVLDRMAHELIRKGVNGNGERHVSSVRPAAVGELPGLRP